MKSKPIIPRELANRDVDEAIEHYLSEDAAPAALGFVEALEQAYAHIGRHPATGSPRYAHELNLPGLRFCRDSPERGGAPSRWNLCDLHHRNAMLDLIGNVPDLLGK